MTENALQLRGWRRIDDLALAFVFMTRLPVRLPGPPPAGALARCMAWFPVVGMAIGLIGGLAYLAAGWLGLSETPSGWIAVLVTAGVTGALHEDGLADSVDGFGGGRDRARKLEIMHDSRIGSYGAIALLASVALRASALAEIGEPWLVVGALVAAHGLARAAAPVMATLLPGARTDGLGFLCGRPPMAGAGVAVLFGLAAGFIGGGPEAFPLVIAAAVAAVAGVSALTMRQLGGYTGDVLGAGEQLCEILILLTLAAA